MSQKLYVFRAATIVATSTGSLWALDRVTFRKILLKNASKKVSFVLCVYTNIDETKTLLTQAFRMVLLYVITS